MSVVATVRDELMVISLIIKYGATGRSQASSTLSVFTACDLLCPGSRLGRWSEELQLVDCVPTVCPSDEGQALHVGSTVTSTVSTARVPVLQEQAACGAADVLSRGLTSSELNAFSPSLVGIE